MSKQVRILLCEDDESLGGLLKDFFDTKGFVTTLYHNGEEALEGVEKGKYDLCILDVMMPRIDGFTTAERIRKIDDKVPLIFLTAKTQKEDVLRGFAIGADDYIRKPFSLDELMARMEVILRRTRETEHKIMPFYQIGKFLFDTQAQLITFEGGEPQKLTTKENSLLALLCAFANRTLERSFALEHIWENDNYFNARSMDVYITKLRKILKPDPSVEIKNVHGKGYRLSIQSDVTPSEEDIQKL